MMKGEGRIDEQVAHVTDRLVVEFSANLPPAEIRSLASDAYAPLRDARVTQFVPVLVARSVRERVRSDEPGAGHDTVSNSRTPVAGQAPSVTLADDPAPF